MTTGIPLIDVPIWVRAYRFLAALLAIAAMGTQLWVNHRDDKGTIGNYFSFFTIQSNIIAVIVLLIGASGASFVIRPTFAWNLARGGAAIYMTLTFIVYGLLLTGEDLQVAEPWVNNVVHRIVPIVMIIDFLIRPLYHKITFRQSLVWAIFPIAWLVYTIIRGIAIGWYPYPFLDPDKAGGWPGVGVICVVIAIGFLGASWFMTAIGQRLSIRLANRTDQRDTSLMS